MGKKNEILKSIYGAYTIDYSGKKKTYKFFNNETINNNQTVLSSIDNKLKITIFDLQPLRLFIESEKVKKCAVRFKISNHNNQFLIHNESVLDLTTSGIFSNLKCGKSTYFLSVKSGNKYYNFANELPCKFISCFEFKKVLKYYYIDFITEYPDSYDGYYKSESLLVSNENAIDAIKNFNSQNEQKEFEKPMGWSTWDYYFTDINEECIKENVDFIANDKILSKKIEYISIDDGWEQSEGQWKEGANFPSGLKNVVKYIKDKGFKAGIWTCPVRFNTLSATIMRRNEFLIKDEFGDPIIFDGTYVLDPTHPEGEKFIRETYTYLASCGFEYYKIDFIAHILAGENFYDKKAGPFDALRHLLMIVRECVGKSHILGCNMPYGVGYGFVDSKRVGLDIHNTFGHIVKCSEIYLPQFASQGKIYQNDLDYLLVRGDETANDDKHNVLNPTGGYWSTHTPISFRWRCGKDFSYNEAKIWCSILLMSGSSIFLGDRVSKLNEKGLDLIYKVLNNVDYKYATPIDLFEKPFPSIWEKENTVILLNLTDKRKNYTITVSGDYEYRDIFTETIYKTNNKNLEVIIEPHDSLYLKRLK